MARDLIEIGGVVVDPETGEIVDGEQPEHAETLALLIYQHLAAKQAEKDYGAAKGALSAAIKRLMDEDRVTRFESEYGSVTRTKDAEITVADAERVATAATEEVITHSEAADLLIRAAKDLDAKAVQAWIAEQPDEERRKVLRSALLRTTKRAGYANTSAPKSAPPPVKRRTAKVAS